jgi:nitrate reductase delta subunit
MLKDFKHYCKAVSVLLHYPEQRLLTDLQALGPILARTACTETRQALRGFIAYLQKHPLAELQMRYTALFDLLPAASLNLACHLPGDAHQQARRMSDLMDVYAAAGYEKISDELPDYLPLLLEFISLRPDTLARPAVRRALAGLDPLVTRLQQSGPAYALLLQPLHRWIKSVLRAKPAGEDRPPAFQATDPLPQEEVRHEHH